MEEVILRFPHLGEDIFNWMNNENLQRSRNISRSWNDFISNQKFFWIRIIKDFILESNKDYTDCPKKWKRNKTKLENIN